VSASVNLPLHHKVQKFSSGNGSPRWSPKKGRKMVVVVVASPLPGRLWTNVTSHTKLEVHKVLHCRHQRSKPQPQLTWTHNFVKSEHAIFSEREREFTFATVYMLTPIRLLSVVGNARAPYSGSSNFPQYFYGVRYLGPFGRGVKHKRGNQA